METTILRGVGSIRSLLNVEQTTPTTYTDTAQPKSRQDTLNQGSHAHLYANTVGGRTRGLLKLKSFGLHKTWFPIYIS